jgi:hypothetical protein
MIRKIKQWWLGYKIRRSEGTAYSLGQPEVAPKSDVYTYEQLKKAYNLGYTDGKRDGLAIARQQAVKTMKEILWAQNKAK